MEKENQSPKFCFLAQQILNLNLPFFERQVLQEKKTYFCHVKISYNFEASLSHSIDLGPFPIVKKCQSMDELTLDQQKYLIDNKKNISKAPPKLISAHEKDGELSDFIVGLLYVCVHHSCQIVDVLSIIEYEVADVFGPWVGYLSQKRASSTCTLEGKIMKNLGEALLSVCFVSILVRLSCLISVILPYFS